MVIDLSSKQFPKTHFLLVFFLNKMIWKMCIFFINKKYVVCNANISDFFMQLCLCSKLILKKLVCELKNINSNKSIKNRMKLWLKQANFWCSIYAYDK